ncbi:MAG TPA: UvrD-helicase domain-containing protein [Chitinophagaceae bacterium]|jgi:superfamily I DNA/RNA helicase|nr:UvrD-helicase domain-containing protein [Chitinophagaceae bacterium]HMU58677.1 UvrD-helicase domain-containing protein [Chitinophagaceae bacterium]
MNNKLIIAAAGSGKTTVLVKKALEIKDEKVLITTYTQANEAEIRKKIIEINKFIPQNVTVQTWFSFLLQHGARPFQGYIFEKKIKGLILVNSKSGLKAYMNQCQECKQKKVVKDNCTKCKNPIYFGEEKEFEKHYFTNGFKIYSDKLSKFVFRCNKKSGGAVISRLSKIYKHIFIDEVQDLAGYDLELLKLFFTSNIQILLVGDPRQGTYSTNSSSKNKQYKKSEIVHFFEDESIEIETDKSSLLVNYRCTSPICELSNKLFPDFQGTTSGNNCKTVHDGIFFIKESDIDSYLNQYTPIQLRDSKRKVVNEKYSVMNFGESKGLSFDRVLIYPTQPIIDWVKDNTKELAPTSKSKLYVAITRARYSVGIVYNFNNKTNIAGIQLYET